MPNNKIQMPNEIPARLAADAAASKRARQSPNAKKKYDLEGRTAKFGEAIIEFAKEMPRNPVTISLISQLVRAGTSVGSNYCEADGAESKKDFKHKIALCKKEAKEIKHWLRMVVKATPFFKGEGEASLGRGTRTYLNFFFYYSL